MSLPHLPPRVTSLFTKGIKDACLGSGVGRNAERLAWVYNRLYAKLFAMSKESLEALLAKLKDDEELQKKLKGAASLDEAVALGKEAGFDISKYDFLENKRLIGPHLLWEWSWI